MQGTLKWGRGFQDSRRLKIAKNTLKGNLLAKGGVLTAPPPPPPDPVHAHDMQA